MRFPPDFTRGTCPVCGAVPNEPCDEIPGTLFPESLMPSMPWAHAGRICNLMVNGKPAPWTAPSAPNPKGQ